MIINHEFHFKTIPFWFERVFLISEFAPERVCSCLFFFFSWKYRKVVPGPADDQTLWVKQLCFLPLLFHGAR